MFRFRPNRMKGGVCLLVAMHGIASTRFFRRRKRLPFVMWEWSFLYCSSGIVGKDILYYYGNIELLRTEIYIAEVALAFTIPSAMMPWSHNNFQIGLRALLANSLV